MSYENYAKAILILKETSGEHKELDKIFTGSKITSRFIYRTLHGPKESDYYKDIKEYGQKIDDIALRVIKAVE
jgi:hypothetical protein